jgi:hypothetical protein
MRGTVPGERRWWLPLALIPPVVLFLLLPISRPVWNLLPELRLLQFPWRWLVVLEAPMAISFASAVWFNRRTPRIVVLSACAALFVGISVLAYQSWFLESNTFAAEVQESVREGAGVLGKPEYAPPGIKFPQVDKPVPDACLLDASQGSASSAPAWDGESASCNTGSWRQPVLMGASQSAAAPYMQEARRITGVAEHAGYLILRLRYYPAWAVKVNGVPVTPTAERERGLMAVPVPQGNVRVSVDWTTTSDAVAGRWVSVAALLLIAGLYAFERRRLWAHSNSNSPVVAEEPKPRKADSKHPTPSARTNNRNAGKKARR